MASSADVTEHPEHDVRGVLAIPTFRRLWVSLSISSFGDWLGLLATTAMAAQLGGMDSYLKANLAVSGVLLLRMAPAIVFGPIAGVFADRFDRKRVMVVGDLLRAVIYLSIPIVGTLQWLFIATVLSEIVGLFWVPAKDASVPNLVPRSRLEAANQLSLASTYGSAPVAALAFSGLALLTGVVNPVADWLGPNDLALVLNALTYLYAAWVVGRLVIPRTSSSPDPEAEETGEQPSFWRTLVDGWKFVGSTPQIRGLVVGMLGAFGAGGFVIGVAPSFTRDLGAGSAGYGIMFGAVFTGLALGMWLGPRVLSRLPRWRLFGLSLSLAGVFLAMVALIPEIVLASALTVAVGMCSGVAWVTGYTMLGLEVEDSMRGRTFAFVQSAARVVLVGVMALAPALAAVLGTHHWRLTTRLSITLNGAALTLFVASVLAVIIGLVAYRAMNDHGEVSLLDDLKGSLRPETIDNWWATRRSSAGFFIAVEGGDGAGKSTQVAALQDWVAERGHEVVVTREPGATEIGKQIRNMVLHGGSGLSPRAESLMFAADRAQHVAEVIRPALERGAVVITDRFIDSSVAYQGAGRRLGESAITDLSAYATDGMRPDLTILLDLDPAGAQERLTHRGAVADRIEREASDFHQRVREAFLHQARRNPRRYLVLDATRHAADLSRDIRDRLEPLLPAGVRTRMAVNTGPAAPEPGPAVPHPVTAQPATGKTPGSEPATQPLNGDLDEWNRPYRGR